jgi:hypothetical protein
MKILSHLFALLAMCELAVSLPQIVDTKNWRFDTKNVTINADSLTEIRDGQDRFYMKRLAPSKTDWVNDCYEVRSDSDKLDADFKFCYPSLHVAGMGKCGTSSVFSLLTHHADITDQNLGKEYCPKEYEGGGLYNYWKGMAPSFEAMSKQDKIYVSGCIHTSAVALMHSILKPKAVYIIIVRDPAERMWAAYNFWCDGSTEKVCNGKFDWTSPGMYRSPGMFDETLKALNYPNFQPRLRYPNSCVSLNTYYSSSIRLLEEVLQPHQLVLTSIEGVSSISSPGQPNAAFQRIERGILNVLGRKVVLEQGSLHLVNAGNDKGKVSTGTSRPVEGLYALSNYEPMLESSRIFIKQCWTECSSISQRTGWDYNCSATLYTTTLDMAARANGFLKIISEEEDDTSMEWSSSKQPLK